LSEKVHFYLTTYSENIISLKLKNKDSSLFEIQLDIIIYKLYKLKYDEVLIIEPEFSIRITRQEFES